MNIRCHLLTLFFSLALHGTLAALGFAVSGAGNEKPEETVYRVSLAEFAPAAPGTEAPGVAAVREPEPLAAPAPEPPPVPEPQAVPEPVSEPVTKPALEPAPEPVPSPAQPKKKPRKPKKKRKTRTKPVQAPRQRKKHTPETPRSSTTAGTGNAAANPPAASVSGKVSGRGAPAAGLRTIGGLSAYDADVVDQRPAIARKALPEYPKNARRRNLQGKVVLRIVVDSAGTPRHCSVHASEPAGVFDRAALAAARKTRFIPGRLNGRPVNTVILLPYYFALR